MKDSFYYSLKERCEYAQKYAFSCATKLKHLEINNKADKEFFKNNTIEFIFDEIINLPTNLLRYLKIYKMKVNLKKCLADIEVIKKELSTYEQNRENN